MEEERVVTSKKQEEDTFEGTIRPDSIDEYIGQSEVKDNLDVFIKAAKCVMRLWIMFCYMVLQVLVRQLWLI